MPKAKLGNLIMQHIKCFLFCPLLYNKVLQRCHSNCLALVTTFAAKNIVYRVLFNVDNNAFWFVPSFTLESLILQPGDIVECEIDEIGCIRNEVIAHSKF